MLEYILIVAVINAAIVGFGAYVWLTRERAPANTAKKQTPNKQRPSVPATAEATKAPTLDVAGAIHPPKGRFSFLKLFGLGSAPVFDLCYLPGPLTKENLAPLVSSSLAQMHVEGDAVGSDVMDFLYHGKVLSKNEVLCFALLAQPNQLGHRIVAFVDTLRFPAPAAK